MKKSKELKPIDVSKFNITETGQVLKYLEEEKLDKNNDDLMVAYEMVEFTFNALVNELHTK